MTHENDTRGRNANSHGLPDGLSDPQRAYFPPNLTLSPLTLLERDFQRRTNDSIPPLQGDTRHGQSTGTPGSEGAAAHAGESTSTTEDTTDTSTSHGEATNVAFVASSGASRTWAQRCAEDGRFRNKFEALVASEVSEGSVEGGRGRGGGGEFVCFLFLFAFVFVLGGGTGGRVVCVLLLVCLLRWLAHASAGGSSVKLDLNDFSGFWVGDAGFRIWDEDFVPFPFRFLTIQPACLLA